MSKLRDDVSVVQELGFLLAGEADSQPLDQSWLWSLAVERAERTVEELDHLVS